MDLVQKRVAAGRPAVPYLFLLVADVLQSAIKSAGAQIRHPLVDEACPVLQYADDTLPVLRADVDDASHLKVCLDQFAQTTELKINFHKSTVVPMHVPPVTTERLVSILQCQVGSFP